MKEIPISAAKLVAEKYGYDQIVIVGRKVGEGGMTLPDCMMPDGAEPCKAYLELQAEIERLKDRIDEHHRMFEPMQAEIKRLRAALEEMLEDPPATLDEPDHDWEAIVKMRVIARAALRDQR